MAKKGKNPEEEAQQTPPPQPIEEAETPAIKAINDQYKAAARNIEEGYQGQEEAVTKAYDEQIGGYDTFLGEVGKRKEELSAMDEASQKRAQAYRYIAGIGDAISGVANLVGTAHGAANQQQEYNAPGIMAKAEEQRKARKLEMDQLQARMDELKAQRSAMQGTRDLKLGELSGKKAAELAGLELQKGRDIRTAEEAAKAEAFRQKQFDEGVRQFNEGVRQFNEGQQFRKDQWEAQKSQWQKTYDLNVRQFEEAQKANSYNVTISGESFDIPKSKLSPGNIERIWKQLPQDVRDSVKGKTVTTYETDDLGQSQRRTSNEEPTSDQKLAAVVAYADYDGDVASELKRLAGISGAPKDEPKSNPADDPNL